MTPSHALARDGVELRRRAKSAVEALYATAHALLARRQFAEAGSICRTMLSIAPHDERGWLVLGACHEGLAQNEIALELYGAGHSVCPKSVRCELARFRLLRGMGKSEQAEAALRRAVERAEATADPDLDHLVDQEARLS
jgi:tetratricopeptide (TPR) repeat protein